MRDHVHFDTEKYEAAHGRKPRGRGLWAFGVHVCGGSETHFHGGSLPEAKRAMTREILSQPYTYGLDCGAHVWVDILP